MTDVDERVRYLATMLRKLADIVEEHPPSIIDFQSSNMPPVEIGGAGGFIEYLPREGLESVDIALRWGA